MVLEKKTALCACVPLAAYKWRIGQKKKKKKNYLNN